MRCILEFKHTDEVSSVVVEPDVTISKLTHHLQHGYVLEYTLEIEEATLGGLAMATGMTTHSHTCGLLNETVLAYEVDLANVLVVQVTEATYPDFLFHPLSWSHRTLELLVLFKSMHHYKAMIGLMNTVFH